MNTKFLNNKNLDNVEARLQPNIDSKFGLEIECGLLNEEDRSILENLIGIKVKNDKSITCGIPTEIVTPTYENTKVNIGFLKNLSSILKQLPMDLSTCSFQTNIDCDLSYEELYNLLLLTCVYEREIYKFSMGSDNALRKNVDKFAESMRMYIKALNNIGYNDEGIVENFIGTKKWMLSFKCKKDQYNRSTGPVTYVEFRTPNGTVDFELWMNYLNTFYNMIRVSKNLDREKLEFLFDGMNYETCYESIAMENPRKAIEFANIIFPTEHEQLYFFKQYFGYYSKEGKGRVLKLN